MYQPSFEQFQSLAKSGNTIPVYRVIMADLETPVSAFMKIARDDPKAFLLESVEQGERLGRYSFIGCNPPTTFWCRDDRVGCEFEGKHEEYTLENGQDPLSHFKSFLAKHQTVPLEGLPPFTGGLVGFLSYEMTGHFENLTYNNRDDYQLPDAVFYFADTVVAFDHFNRTMMVISNAYIEGDEQKAYQTAVQQIDAVVERLRTTLPPVSFGAGLEKAATAKSNWEQEPFREAVERCKEYIRAGDIFQVVIGLRNEIEIQSDALDLYRALRRVNPSPYTFFFRYGNAALVGASPEILVRLNHREVTYRPIAGTRRRGRTSEEEAFMEKELINDPKEQAEHIMLVDLGRNDIGRVCDFHSVKVSDLMYVERYSHVMHLVSNVEGILKSGMDGFDLIRATFPAGTVTGAPKIRAMEIIEELEPTRRGPYAGAVGWFGLSGDLDFCITLRTILVKDQVAYVQAGAGIVADSQPALEFKEVMNKSGAMLRAIEMAECANE